MVRTRERINEDVVGDLARASENAVCRERSFVCDTGDVEWVGGVRANDTGDVRAVPFALVKRVVVGYGGVEACVGIADEVVTQCDLEAFPESSAGRGMLGRRY